MPRSGGAWWWQLKTHSIEMYAHTGDRTPDGHPTDPPCVQPSGDLREVKQKHVVRTEVHRESGAVELDPPFPNVQGQAAGNMIPNWYRWRMAMTLRLNPEDERVLTALAEADGVSKQEATVRAIREAAARRGHEDRVRVLSAAGRERYADLLERLGR